MAKEIQLISDEVIISKIYVIRGRKVMIDRDLALLYDVETRALNQAVKRNEKRFPDDFMFQMTKEEPSHDNTTDKHGMIISPQPWISEISSCWRALSDQIIKII